MGYDHDALYNSKKLSEIEEKKIKINNLVSGGEDPSK